MRQGTDIERQTRYLMKALEPTLRRHLGADGVNRQFVAGLYGRLHQSLDEFGGLGLGSGKRAAADLQRLAFDVYLTAATHLEGSEVTPALLSSVKKEIERVVADLSR